MSAPIHQPAVPAPVDALIAALPKVELHVHLEGSMQPGLLLELARKHRIPDLPSSLEAVRQWYQFRDFPHFIDIYRLAVQTLRDEEDFARLAADVIADLAAQNVRYAEINISVHDHLTRGIPAEVVFGGIEQGRRRAERAHDITVRWIADFPGEPGTTAGDATLDAVLASGPESVLGLSIGGIEVDREPFANVFARARAVGLYAFPHAGETEGPDRVWSAIRALGADRIGHGIGAMDDPELITYLRDVQLPLDVAPTSNLRTGAAASLAEHPLPRMLDAGLLITLNSDDPPMFDTDLINEYRTAYRAGLPDAALIQLARNGIHASFADASIKTRLLAEISLAEQEFSPRLDAHDRE